MTKRWETDSPTGDPVRRRFGHPVFHFAAVESTNDKALELLERGKPEGTLILADRQTRGRGRRERAWDSPAHLGLYASLLLRPVLAPRQLTLVPLAMGVGIVRALRTAGISRVGLKWPNDLLVQGKKLGGILSETRGEAGRAGVVVGIGLNVNQDEDDFPEHLQGKATSLKRESGKLWDLMAVLGEVLASCEKEYDALQAEGPEPLLKRFESLSVFERGDRLRVESPQGVVEGRYAGLGCSGELLLKVGSAPPRAFHFGDVARVREE